MKKLISKGIADVISAKISKSEPEFKRLDISGFFRLGVGGIIIKRCNDETELHLTEVVSSKYIKIWKEDVGMLAYQDIKNGGENMYEVTLDTCRVILLELTDSKQIKKAEGYGIPVITTGLALTGKHNYVIVKVLTKNEPYSSLDDSTMRELTKESDKAEIKAIKEELGMDLDESEADEKESSDDKKPKKKSFTPSLF